MGGDAAAAASCGCSHARAYGCAMCRRLEAGGADSGYKCMGAWCAKISMLNVSDAVGDDSSCARVFGRAARGLSGAAGVANCVSRRNLWRAFGGGVQHDK